MDSILQVPLIAIGIWLGLMLLSVVTRFFYMRAQQPLPEAPPAAPATPISTNQFDPIYPFH